MRPYLAVLKDSFREALASRVLWILIIVTTLLLVLSAPAGFKEIKATELKRNSVREWPTLAARIEEQDQAGGSSPGKQIWQRLSSPLKQSLLDAATQSPGELSGDLVNQFVDDLNRVIGDPTLYDAEAWRNVQIGTEAQSLIEQSARTVKDTLRLNRLLIEADYKSEFRKGESTETAFVYAWKEWDPLPVTHQQATQAVRALLLVAVDYGVGVFGVFAAILVTASIIPQMFEAGAIDLLLSKPVSRMLLFLTKFLGGCIFIGLNASYFITGLWLIAGARFGIWANKLFLCIPIMLFLFAVYYSVSALAAVLWRNAIVSIVLTILFWLLCVSVAKSKNSFIEPIWIDPQRLVKLIPAGQSLLAVTEPGQVEEWDPRQSLWEEVFSPPEQPQRIGPLTVPQPMIGPVYDEQADRILAIPTGLPAPGGMNLFGPPPTLQAGKRSAAWTRKKVGSAPAGPLALLTAPNGDTLVVTKGAVFRLTQKKSKSGGSKSAKSKNANADVTEEFVRLGPEPSMRLDTSAAVAMNKDSGAIATFSRGILTVLEPDAAGKKYVRKNEKELVSSKDAKLSLAAFAAKTIVIARSDGQLLIVDTGDLSVKHELQPFGENAPRLAGASPGGRWLSVLFHNRKLWLYDVQNDRPVHMSLTGQGDISAAVFNGPNRLLAADRANRVTQYELDPWRAGNHYEPPLGNMEMGYYYFLSPLYTILPKPGELGTAVAYLLADKDEDLTHGFDLSQQRERVDVAGPIWSSLAFLVVMLTLSCLYVRQADF